MVSLLRTFVAQFLCLALVTADFAPPAQGQVPIGKAGVWVMLPFYAGRRAPESFRNAVRAGYSTSTDRRPVRSRQNAQPQLTNLPGQSSTALPDGRLLLLGGEGKQGPVNSAAILDPASSAITELPSGLSHARASHSATLLPTGKVFVFGGVGTGGDVVTTAEVFDPATKQFADISPLGLTPRAHHSATLLTDGTVFVSGGLDAHNQTLGTVQVWSPQTNAEINIDAQLISPRSDHTATLQADGTVLLWGGKNRVGLTLDYGEVYDPTAQSFRIQNTKPQTGQGVLTVAATIPGDGSESVSLNAVIAIRFSLPILMQSANNNTVTLTTGTQQTSASVVPAEAGMLLFVSPQDSLAADAEYTVNLNGIVSTTGSSLGEFSFLFRTAAQGGSQNSSSGIMGLPTSAAGFGQPENSPYLKLPRLQAPAGETAISGQVLLQSGLPLEGVMLRVAETSTRTDATGRFLLAGVSPGHDVLVIDGRTANTKTVTYGVFEVGVDVKNRETNILDYTTWMPVIDTAHAVSIAFPTAQETVITTPLIHGLEFHLPSGATVTDIDGKVADKISITPIPVSQPPFPLPERANVPLYFTIQPGGGIIAVSSPDGPQGGWLIHPNTAQRKPGTRYHFWNYDPEKQGWHVKGSGSVVADGSTVVPDSGVVFNSLAGVSVTCAPIPSNGPNCCGDKDGDPVDLGTGLFVYQKTDLYEPDVIPIDLTRVYRQNDPIARDFGVGSWHQYDMFVGSTDSANCSYMDLFLPGFTRIHFTRYSPGSDCGVNGPIPVFTCNTCPGEWFGSTLFWTEGFSGHWAIFRRDGMTFDFHTSANATIQGLGLVSISDPNGNYLVIARDQNQYITQITTNNGRFISFSYNSNHNVSQAQDGFGRTVQYSYDSNNRLTQVIDANGGVWKYGYDSNNNMKTITNPRQITYLTNNYDSNDRVYQQIHADGGMYQFTYTTDPLGNVTETDMTDPRGNVRKVTFNQPPIYYDGYSTGGSSATDTYAAGTSIAQTTSYQYDPGTYLLTSSTDALGRMTSYTYDSAGNMTSVTRLAGTPNQVTTTYTYEDNLIPSEGTTGTSNVQTMTRLSSVTDPLGHTTQYTYDLNGNRLSTTDPLGNTTTYSNDSEGRIVAVTDAMGDTTQFAYNGPDLAQVTDALGRSTTLSVAPFNTPGFILAASTDPLGHVTQFRFDANNQLVQIVDPSGAGASLGFDPDGDLSSFTDASQNPTQYTYDSMDRLQTRKDPLGNTETYQYDGMGNLTQFTDRRGKITTYIYDPLNRMSFAGYGTQAGPTYESTINYTYDLADRLTNVVDSQNGNITRVFDGLDRMTSETTPQGAVGYAFDGAGRKQTMTVNGQPTVNYTFNVANRLTQMTQGSSTVQINYDTANRRSTLTLPNGLITTYNRDGASQLQSMNYTVGSTLIGNISYAYDLSGKRTSTSGSFARTGLPNALSTAGYNANNQLTTWGTANLFYDANGNVTSDGTHSYTWDARNHLKQIDAGVTASFNYDAFDRRVSKTILGSNTNFLYDGANVVQELSGTTPSANLLTGRLDEYFQRTDSAGARYFVRDALGSTLALVDSTGALQTTYTFEPFGTTSANGVSTSNSFLFTGRELDAASPNLYFFRARYYNSQLQRFISEDPIEFQGGVNLYVYVGNEPTLKRDPFGRQLAPPIPWPAIWGGAASGPWGWVIVGGALALTLLLLYLQTRTKSEPRKEPKCKDQEKCKEQYAADIAWCDETFGDDEDPSTYFACTQIADLNAERCLNGQQRLNPDPRWYKKRF